jgi:pimeloyl-ACP methyl ester carboxylesterase
MTKELDVTFTSDDVALAGTLWLPDEPVAAVVMVGGSGPSNRNNDVFFPPIRDHLNGQRIAVLSYDKRGVGASEGSWSEATIDDYAADARAAYDELRKQLGAVPVGLFGHSEGGWTVLRAAPHCLGVAFVITNSTPGVPPAVQDRYAVEFGMRASGESEEFIAEALTGYDELIERARHGAPWAEVEQRLRAEPGVVSYYGDPGEDDWRSLAAKVDHDPVPDLAAVTCPALALFGAVDPLIDVPPSVAAFALSARQRPAQAPLTIAVFPQAGHRLELPDSALAPDYLETLSGWISTVASARGETSGSNSSDAADS